jgi:hypothetical protein
MMTKRMAPTTPHNPVNNLDEDVAGVLADTTDGFMSGWTSRAPWFMK